MADQFVWKLAGGGGIASAGSYYASCFARKEPPPGDPIGGPPIFFEPTPIDTIVIFNREKAGFMEPGETAGPVNGTITAGGGTFAALGIIAFDSATDGRSDITFSVGGVLTLTEFFSGSGVRNAAGDSNLRISGFTITTPGVVSLNDADVQGAIAVSSDRPTSGFTISGPDVRIANRVTTGDVFIGFGAGSTGVLKLSPGATLEQTDGAKLLFVGQGGTGTLDVGSGAVVKTNGLLAGLLAGSSGTVSVHDGGRIDADLTPSSRVEIGRRGSADLTIGPGSTVKVAGEIQIGTEFGGDGFIRVDAGGKLMTDTGFLRVGGLDQGLGTGGTGKLVVNGGTVELGGRALIGASEGGKGAVEITGGSLTLKERLVVGHAGEGTLMVSGDGKLKITTPLDGEGLRIGRWATGKGTVEFSGPDATVEGLGNHLVVGLLGEGTLKITDGFLLDMSAGEITLGREAGSKGTLIVRDVFSEVRSKDLTIGETGTGVLQILGGGKVVTSGIATIGEIPPTSGTTSEVTVADSGSIWEVGKLEIGSDAGAHATVTVSGGGVIRITGASDVLKLGVEKDTFGKLVIDGVDSRIETPAGPAKFVFGVAGEGVVELKGGTTASLGALVLGQESTGSGTLRVVGTGTQVDATSMIVGGKGQGLLAISGGGSVETTGVMVIGQDLSGAVELKQDGQVNVFERGSKLEVGGDLTVGDHALGGLQLSDGGSAVVHGELRVGDGVHGVGILEIKGSGAAGGGDQAELKTNGAITLGRDGGDGKLVISDGGKLTGTTSVPVKITLGDGGGSNGRIELDSGQLSSRDLIVGAGGEARIVLKGTAELLSSGQVEIGGKAGVASGTGTVQLTGESKWLVTGGFARSPLVIGNQRNGLLLIEDSARLEAGEMRIGTSMLADGAILVLDPGARIENKLKTGESVVVGYESDGDNRVLFGGRDWKITSIDGGVAELVIGREGKGRVDINGGALTVGTPAASPDTAPENGRLRVGIDGRAELVVSGSGSVHTTTLEIGTKLDAKVTLNGGTLVARKATLDGALSVLEINAGGSAKFDEIDSKGRIVVQGDGTRLSVEKTLKVEGAGATLHLLDAGGISADRLRLTSVTDAIVANSGASGGGLSVTTLEIVGSKLVVNPGGSIVAVKASIGGAGAAPRSQLDMHGGALLVSDVLRVGFASDAEAGLSTPGPGDLIVGDFAQVGVGSMLFVGALGHVDTRGGRIAVGSLLPDSVPIGELHVFDGGTLRGCSSISAARVVVHAGGTADPGCSPGKLVVDGDFVIEAGGILHVEIAGLGDGAHDLLDVLGNLVIGDGATLLLDFLDGFAPEEGDLVDFISYGGSVVGGFSRVRVSGLADGWDYGIGVTGDGEFRLVSMSDAVSSNVAEPGTLALSLAGLALLAGLRQRRMIPA